MAELADPQPEQGTFSFIRLGEVFGRKDTAVKTIELEIPAFAITVRPALCKNCRKQYEGFFWGRYLLADLYSKEENVLIPIHKDLNKTIRCYEITVQDETRGILRLIIHGTLES